MNSIVLFKNFLKFASMGIMVEICFTAFCNILDARKFSQKIDWDLKGHSYVWMIPIYGSIAIFAHFLLPLFAAYPLLLRWLIYGVIILIVEYVTGFIIRKITGKCPWHYESKWALHNLIRFDYLPLWMVFGGITEWYFYF